MGDDRPTGSAGYVLSGHTDTVPVTGQAWTSDPYRLRRSGGRLYARGAVDMKGFLAVCLAHVQRCSTRELGTPIHLAISYDEEVGCTGVRPMLAEIARLPVRPLGCFVGEPTLMRRVIGHKSKHSMRAIVRGKACHSALTTDGVNAVEAAAELIADRQRKAAALAASGARDPAHQVPFTTGLTTIAQGGIANNIVPDRCEVEFEFRGIAADDPRAICEAVMAEARATIEPRDAGARSAPRHRVRRACSNIPRSRRRPTPLSARSAKRLSGQRRHVQGRRSAPRPDCSTRWPAFPPS